jgi:hypothetical protein
MLLTLGVLGILALASSVSQGASGHHTKRSPCSLKGSKTRYRDAAMRVYSKFERDISRRTTYACLFRADRRVRIAEAFEPDGVDALDRLRAAPPFIAYHEVGCEKADCGTPYVLVVDLRTGKKRGDYAGWEVQGLGVTPAGSVAWMESPGATSACESAHCVRKLGAGASFDASLLDSGDALDASSFAVGGKRIFWIKAGAPQSATMP